MFSWKAWCTLLFRLTALGDTSPSSEEGCCGSRSLGASCASFECPRGLVDRIDKERLPCYANGCSSDVCCMEEVCSAKHCQAPEVVREHRRRRIACSGGGSRNSSAVPVCSQELCCETNCDQYACIRSEKNSHRRRRLKCESWTNCDEKCCSPVCDRFSCGGFGRYLVRRADRRRRIPCLSPSVEAGEIVCDAPTCCEGTDSLGVVHGVLRLHGSFDTSLPAWRYGASIQQALMAAVGWRSEGSQLYTLVTGPSCPPGMDIVSEAECAVAYTFVQALHSLPDSTGVRSVSSNSAPAGCSVDSRSLAGQQGLLWNDVATLGAPGSSAHRALCRAHDASKCLDAECCASPGLAACAAGFEMVFSDRMKRPDRTTDRVLEDEYYYQCVPAEAAGLLRVPGFQLPGRSDEAGVECQWLPSAPGEAEGDEANDTLPVMHVAYILDDVPESAEHLFAALSQLNSDVTDITPHAAAFQAAMDRHSLATLGHAVAIELMTLTVELISAQPSTGEEGATEAADQAPIAMAALVGIGIGSSCVLLLCLACCLPKLMATCGLSRYRSKSEVQVVEEEDIDSCHEDAVLTTIPKYWRNSGQDDFTTFDHLMYVSKALHPLFNGLFDKTYEGRATQDRVCPSGSCAKTPGGCPCVQPGSEGFPPGYRVRRIVRIENSSRWESYIRKRAKIRERLASERLDGMDPRPRTDILAAQHPETFATVERRINEVYLWHGTEVRSALSIAQDGFKLEHACPRRLFGRGFYMTESSTKADEYGRDEAGGYYEGTYAMLLCRVCMGKLYYTESDMGAKKQVASGDYDSVLGDRLQASGTFREFVLYNADQVYPEYVVFYTRMPMDVNVLQYESFLANMPFHLELPIYWKHCHKNPETDQFQAHFVVRRKTRDLLQKLANASLGGVSGPWVDIISARRVENADIWNRYMFFQQQLRNELFQTTGGTSSGFSRAEEFSEDPTKGKVLTSVALRGMELEDAISIENVEEGVNEHFLWHGTTKRAVEEIVRKEFAIPVGSPKSVRHGHRFGNGAYFAEELWKALDYAKLEESGVQFVLLCRVLCGNMYYTEANVETDADYSARLMGRHSVLANPEKQGPREFVVCSESQIYPEYILELRLQGVPETQ